MKSKIWIKWRKFIISHRLLRIDRWIHKGIMKIFPSVCDHIYFLDIANKRIHCKNCGYLYDTID